MRKPPCVLVLDDDPGSATLQARTLERAGNRVLTAQTIEEAFDKLERNHVDVIAVDYRLRGDLTGLGFCARLRAGGSRTPVVMVSGASDDVTVVQALRIGVQDFVMKDSTFLERLPGVITSLVARADLEAQLAATIEGEFSGSRSSLILLLQSDEESAREQVKELVQAGYSLAVAKTAEEFILVARTRAVGLLIFDQGDGVETALDIYARLRDMGYEFPAILAAENLEASNALTALRVGIREYLPKGDRYLSELPKTVQRVFDRIHLERQAAESNARLAAIVSSATDIVMTVDCDGGITFANPAAEVVIGCEPGQITGQAVGEIFPELFKSEPSGSLELSNPPRSETKALRCDGVAIPVEVSVRETITSGRKFFVLIGRDVSERKRAEAALLDANKELRRLNADLEQFAYSTSHDLKEPLRNISLYAEMLKRELGPNLTNGASELLAQIIVGSVRMDTLIDDLMTYTQLLKRSEIERGGSRELVAPAQVIKKVLIELRPLLEDSGSAVTVVEASLPRLFIEEAHLRHLFQNLILNSVKYRGEEPPLIEISASKLDECTLFRIADNGMGIEQQFHETIFGLFKRLHTRDRYEGSGIGLALCRRIVEQHGGRIWVESNLGEGATFFFTLPGAEIRANRRDRA